MIPPRDDATPPAEPPSPPGRGQGEGVRVEREPSVSAILLAAGKSTRMGRQKLLLPYAGTTVIAHTARQILASAVSHLFVVTSTAEHDAIARALAGASIIAVDPASPGDARTPDSPLAASHSDSPASLQSNPPSAPSSSLPPIELLTNPDPTGDMLSSIRCGLLATPIDCDAILVATGDHPSITPHLINRIIDAFRPAPRVIVPTHQGKRGHPLLFPAHYRTEILTRFDTLGLRALLAAHPQDVLELPSDESILHDLDTPSDYQAALDRLP